MDASNTQRASAAGAGRRKASRKRRLIFAAAALCVATLATLLAAEGLFRAFPGLLPYELRVQTALEASVEGLYAADALLEHRAVPGYDAQIPHGECPHHVRTVALPHMPKEWGFRTPPLNERLPIRAAVLGDSFAFGYGVQEDQTLAGHLRASTPDNGQVVNLALSNKTGTLQYELILARFLAHYRPEEVIILHFENDYTDDAFFEKWRRLVAEDALLAYPASRLLDRPDQQGPLAWIKRRSICASLLSNAVHKLASGKERIQGDQAEYVLSPQVLQIVAEDNGVAQRGCELGLAALERMFAACRAASATVTVVMIPSKEQSLAPEKELESHTHFYRRTVAFCRAQGVAVVDLLDSARSQVRHEQLYFAVDGHWTAAGHAHAHRQMQTTIASRPLEGQRR